MRFCTHLFSFRNLSVCSNYNSTATYLLPMDALNEKSALSLSHVVVCCCGPHYITFKYFSRSWFFLEGVDRRKKIIKTRPKSRRHYRQKCISHENKSDSRFLMLGGDVRLSHICEISFESSDVILPESTVHAFPAMQFRSFI